MQVIDVINMTPVRPHVFSVILVEFIAKNEGNFKKLHFGKNCVFVLTQCAKQSYV